MGKKGATRKQIMKDFITKVEGGEGWKNSKPRLHR